MGNRGNGGREDFWRRKRAQDPLPFWPEARRKRDCWPYVGWLGSAVLLGGAYGGGWIGGRVESTPSAPIEWNEVQAVPKAVADPSDADWRARAEAPVLEAESLPAERRPSRQAWFGLCHTGGGTNCVVDGDTIWIDGQNVRIADIDTPETQEPRCASELELGNRATARLHQLVNEGEVTLASIDRDTDVYGRKLRIVSVNGVSVGETLVGEGLARWYEGGRKSWCG